LPRDRIGIELHELAEPPRPRLLVAKYVARPVAAIGFRQFVEIFRDIAGERRGEIVAQRKPAFVIAISLLRWIASGVPERKNPFIRAVLIRRNFPSASVNSIIGVSTASKP